MIVDPVDPNWASDADGALMSGVRFLPCAADTGPRTVDEIAAAPVIAYARVDQFARGVPRRGE